MGVYGTTLLVGATPVLLGTSGRILYNNGAVLGEALTTGSFGSVVLSVGPTLTAPVTITGVVGSSAITINGATQTTSQPALNITQTWNAAQTFTAFKVNATSTSSNAGSLLADFQLGAASQFSVSKAGVITIASAGELAFSTDVRLFRDAANTLAQRNSTNAQTFRLYNTYTDVSNGEWLQFGFSSNDALIRHNKNGTGSARNVTFAYADGDASALRIPSSLVSTLYMAFNTISSAATNGRVNVGGGGGCTSTSGTTVDLYVNGQANPSSTSTLAYYPLYIKPVVNFSAGTPGAGSYEALKIAVTETALPTGQNYGIRFSAGSAGTADKWSVFNDGTEKIWNVSGTNYERWTSGWASNVFHFGTEKGGTGTARSAQWDYGGTTTAAITVPSAITGTIVIGDGAVGSSTAVKIGGATQTATSGTYIVEQSTGTFNPSSTSTMTAIQTYINPTINYSAGTPGAGSYEALKIAAVETAVPTGSNYLIRASSGATGFTDRFSVEAAAGAVNACAGTAIPAGGTAGVGYKFSSTANFGIFFGSGAPTLSAAKGSLYLRSDGTTTNDRAYINTDGGTTWTALTTVA